VRLGAAASFFAAYIDTYQCVEAGSTTKLLKGEQNMATLEEQQKITEAVRSHYGEVALDVLKDQQHGCWDSGCCGGAAGDRISQNLYLADELEGVPLKAALASLGCGNPTALAELRPGEVVLDLGSGGGIDVLLSARRVGPTGFAYGLDMTDPMLELAQRNAAEAGARNVAFLKGDIAAIPLPDASVDVIISNCVINLAADKAPVLREAFRVLKPGGRFAVSDIVVHGGLPADLVDNAELRRDLSSWAGCIAGALTDAEYRAGLAAAGFADIDLEVTRRYSLADLGEPLPDWVARLGDDVALQVVGGFASTFVRATKPALA
jgi:arsenite methyltransferase